TRSTSRRPLGSKRQSSTRSAFLEKSAKLTPAPSQVAPRGYARPRQSVLGATTVRAGASMCRALDYANRPATRKSIAVQESQDEAVQQSIPGIRLSTGALLVFNATLACRVYVGAANFLSSMHYIWSAPRYLTNQVRAIVAVRTTPYYRPGS